MLIESFRPGLIADVRARRRHAARRRIPGLVTCSVTAFGSSEAAARAARLRLPAAGDGRADVGHRRAGRAAAEGRHRGRRPRLRAAGRERHPGRARRARAHRPRPPRRGLADGLRAHVPAQPGHGLGRRGREREAPRQPPPEHRPVRDLRDRRPADRDRGRQRAHLRAAVRGARAAGAAQDERFATNEARVAHADELADRVRGRAARRTPPSTGSTVLREAKVPAGPINEVDEAFALAEELGMEPVEDVDGLPLIRPPLRIDGERPPIRHPPPRLDEHGGDLRTGSSLGGRDADGRRAAAAAGRGRTAARCRTPR